MPARPPIGWLAQIRTTPRAKGGREGSCLEGASGPCLLGRIAKNPQGPINNYSINDVSHLSSPRSRVASDTHTHRNERARNATFWEHIL